MRCKTVRLVVMLALVLLLAPLVASSQAPTKVYRIGLVRPSTASAMASETEAFKQLYPCKGAAASTGGRHAA
jgi:hypothetical protein